MSDRLLEPLYRDHQRILKELDRLEADLCAWKRGEPLDQERIRDFIRFGREFIDRCHHAREENCLFPALERSGWSRTSGPLGVLLEEHEQGRCLLGQVAAALGENAGRTDEELMRKLHDYLELLRGHIAKEDGGLFPGAEEELEASARLEVEGCLALVSRETSERSLS